MLLCINTSPWITPARIFVDDEIVLKVHEIPLSYKDIQPISKRSTESLLAVDASFGRRKNKSLWIQAFARLIGQTDRRSSWCLKEGS